MRILFILPGSASAPVGGPKVVFEYANGLVARGHKVSILLSPLTRQGPALGERIKAIIRYPQRLLDKSYRPDAWFSLDPRVKIHWVPSFRERHIPGADAIVATAWMTAEWVVGYGPDKGRKFYLVQHKETWDGPENRVMNTWRLPLKKIVISRWLQEIAKECGEASVYIPNGLDFQSFALDKPVEQRVPHHVMMLYHDTAWKGSADGLLALELARSEVCHLKTVLFGVSKQPRNLPDWIEYRRNPAQTKLRELYNEAAIFVAPSWTEGWGLSPAEAMMCGAAVAGTDIGGHQEFAVHEQTALLSPPKVPRALANNVVRLVRDQDLRVRLAHAGHEDIQQFTWKRAVDAFEDTVCGRNNVRVFNEQCQ